VNQLERDSVSQKTNKRLEKTLPTILIVDDEPLALNRTKAVFSSSDYRVITCSNAIEAMAVLEKEPIDCIVADIIMPMTTS
jgi:two-component system response regulator GlrR